MRFKQPFSIFYWSVVVSILFGIGACGKSALVPADYVRWVQNTENGLRVEQTKEPLKLTAQYKPIHFIVAQEEKKHELVAAEIQPRLEELGTNMIYFNFRIQTISGNKSPLNLNANEQIYQQRLSHMSFDMQHDFYIIENQDTLKCKLFQFVRNYNLAPYTDFVLGFERSSPLDGAETITKKLVYSDKLFGLGTTEFTIDQKFLNKLPGLKTL